MSKINNNIDVKLARMEETLRHISNKLDNHLATHQKRELIYLASILGLIAMVIIQMLKGGV